MVLFLLIQLCMAATFYHRIVFMVVSDCLSHSLHCQYLILITYSKKTGLYSNIYSGITVLNNMLYNCTNHIKHAWSSVWSVCKCVWSMSDVVEKLRWSVCQESVVKLCCCEVCVKLLWSGCEKCKVDAKCVWSLCEMCMTWVW